MAHPNNTIASLLRIHPRFMRSVHLERDFNDPSSSGSYVLTPMAEQALSRISQGFRPRSTQRAFRIAGDYGSGKSAFGLALARVAADEQRLPRELRRFCGRNRFQPRLATGDTEPLGVTVLRALGVSSPDAHPTTDEVMARVNAAIGKARQKNYDGVLLVLDELGKNLEFAAQHPDRDDIFLLQRLAEEAARSGDRPLVVVVMLHQGVAAYASGLDTTARREWDKVAGRFEEIIYAHPIEQVAALVSATLNTNVQALPSVLVEQAGRAMSAALRAGIYGASAAASLAQLGPRLFPLHPTVLPVLVRAIRKFGQNERSLFSFISATEPMGLQQHAQQPLANAEPFRVHHLFEYVRHNLLPAITTGSSHTHWGLVESMLASTPVDSPEAEQVLKCVALLSLLDAPDLPATEGFLHLALDSNTNRAAVSKAVQTLKERGVLYERGTAHGLCLWPHTSVNLDEAFDAAVAATRAVGDGIEQLCQHLPTEQLVPRGHYFRTGTLRYGEVRFIPATGLQQWLANQPVLNGKEADLHLRVVLPASQSQAREARAQIHQQQRGLNKGLFVAVAEPPTTSATALTDLVAWKWVQSNTPALAGDRYAREEITRQILRAERHFRERLGGLDSLDLPIGERLNWFHSEGESRLQPGRELLQFLGEQCDKIYSKAPKVLNELINRRAPSCAAVAARTKLVEAMAAASDKPFLGMDDTKRPAEMALYLSILQAGGFHVKTKIGWSFQLPTATTDTCKLRPALDEITDALQGEGTDALVSVPRIFEKLALPPFGIREGLHPFILAIYLATHHQRVALYEDGTYLATTHGDTYLRMMKEPQAFQLQYCGLEGVRSDALVRLLEQMKLAPRDAQQADLLDLVRPLAMFIGTEVPDFCRRTNRLSATAVAVRKALMEAREPVRLVFTSLPQACALPPITMAASPDIEELAIRLRGALHEIRTAYPNLLTRIGNALCAAFDVTGGIAAGRHSIAARAAQLNATITEPALKAFSLRLADEKLEDRVWVESVATLIARKAPERWIDNDETEYNHQLETLAAHFRRVEMALIGTTKKLNGHACRIALTKSDGTEMGDLIDWNGLNEGDIKNVEAEISSILIRHGRHGLAGAMRAIWTNLDTKKAKK